MTTGSLHNKTANDELLARNEGGGGSPSMRNATYKTVQGCQLRKTPATATTIVPVCGCSCVQNRRAPKGGGMKASTTTKQQEEPQDLMGYNQQT